MYFLNGDIFMAKEKKPVSSLAHMKNGFVFISAGIAAIIAIYSIGHTIYTHFAKTTEVIEVKEDNELLDQRLELKIIDDEINREQQEVYQLESYKIFQQVEEPKFSETENKILEEKKERIDNLKVQKIRKFEAFEEKAKR